MLYLVSRCGDGVDFVETVARHGPISRASERSTRAGDRAISLSLRRLSAACSEPVEARARSSGESHRVVELPWWPGSWPRSPSQVGIFRPRDAPRAVLALVRGGHHRFSDQRLASAEDGHRHGRRRGDRGRSCASAGAPASQEGRSQSPASALPTTVDNVPAPRARAHDERSESWPPPLLLLPSSSPQQPSSTSPPPTRAAAVLPLLPPPLSPPPSPPPPPLCCCCCWLLLKMLATVVVELHARCAARRPAASRRAVHAGRQAPRGPLRQPRAANSLLVLVTKSCTRKKM